MVAAVDAADVRLTARFQPSRRGRAGQHDHLEDILGELTG
jgi:hypothetical protein